MNECPALPPALRILMAGGFSQSHLMFSQARPHRFIEKPFSVEELLDEVRAAFAGGDLFQPA
ncbi:MAG TPA: hypothetical protein VN794_07200 [Methylomirabilota bacterium]|nr:hypothetical protein [Methylomirabilota bacterium]